MIFLSEVRTRALISLDTTTEKDPLARAKLEAQAMHAACEELIDDALVADEATRIHLVVADDEVNRAIDSLAQNLGMNRTHLLELVHERGMADADYRELLRAQLFLGKLLQLRHATDANVKEATAALHAELRARVYVEDRVAAP